MISIAQLCKQYGKNLVLENIDMNIDDGVVYALLGKNGAGKTTLIHCLIDLIKPDSGTILLNGKPNNTLTPADKRSMGVLGEDLALIDEFNGLEYLRFIGKIYGLGKQLLDKRIDDLFGYFFEDKTDLKKSIATYSTGMKKKIAFCASVLHTPDLLILDEPFSGLDPLVANQMTAFLKRYQQDSRTIFVSSHDLNYVEKIATHIGVLDKCRLQFDSTLRDFTENGVNSLDSALLKILQPNEAVLNKIDWL